MLFRGSCPDPECRASLVELQEHRGGVPVRVPDLQVEQADTGARPSPFDAAGVAWIARVRVMHPLWGSATRVRSGKYHAAARVIALMEQMVVGAAFTVPRSEHVVFGAVRWPIPRLVAHSLPRFLFFSHDVEPSARLVAVMSAQVK